MGPDDDIRKKASIYYVDDPEEGTTGFIWNGENNQQETGYWQKNICRLMYEMRKEI